MITRTYIIQYNDNLIYLDWLIDHSLSLESI